MHPGRLVLPGSALGKPALPLPSQADEPLLRRVREPVQPFVIAPRGGAHRDHRTQELRLPFRARDRLVERGEGLPAGRVRIVWLGHRVAAPPDRSIVLNPNRRITPTTPAD